ncbi:MAG: RNA methyltransferase [Firmicutes bacterium]|jgi:TrmH family RNA methyltransferase|nr:RNA methyltransferase [Candidatus Fermentithermobacillaceae bacterium]
MDSISKKMIKELRFLRDKKFRDETQTYFAEGISIVLSAIEHDAPIRFIVYSPELLDSEVAYSALSEVRGRIPLYEVKEKDFRSISGRDNPIGLGAVISYHQATPESLRPFAGKAYVGLDNVSNPGNLGTIIRTADCFGFSGVFVCGKSTDEYHPECVKASMGSIFSVPVIPIDTSDTLIELCSQHDICLITTSSRASQDITSVKNYPTPLVVLLGSEGTGLSAETLRAGHMQLRIPIKGTVSSLNLSVAAAIFMYDITTKQGGRHFLLHSVDVGP